MRAPAESDVADSGEVGDGQASTSPLVVLGAGEAVRVSDKMGQYLDVQTQCRRSGSASHRSLREGRAEAGLGQLEEDAEKKVMRPGKVSATSQRRYAGMWPMRGRLLLLVADAILRSPRILVG